jgi:L-rhamnose isomerase
MSKSALTKSKSGSGRHIEKAFRVACENYASADVDVDQALKTLFQIPISTHCWQGDNVGGFEDGDGVPRWT